MYEDAEEREQMLVEIVQLLESVPGYKAVRSVPERSSLGESDVWTVGFSIDDSDDDGYRGLFAIQTVVHGLRRSGFELHVCQRVTAWAHLVGPSGYDNEVGVPYDLRGDRVAGELLAAFGRAATALTNPALWHR